MLTIDEQQAATALVLKFNPFRDSIKRRGLDVLEVVVTSSTIGWFGEKHTERLIKAMPFYLNGSVNTYLRPIEGMRIIVNLDKMEVTTFKDRFMGPLPKANGTEYRFSHLKPPFGTSLQNAIVFQPDGPGFKINGILSGQVYIFGKIKYINGHMLLLLFIIFLMKLININTIKKNHNLDITLVNLVILSNLISQLFHLNITIFLK